MPRLGRYYISSPRNGSNLVPDQICLDLNVRIDIERFYYGTTKEFNEDLKNFFLTFPFSLHRPQTHISSGWAIEEYSWKRTGEFHDSERRSLEWAVQQVLDWEPDRIEFEFSHRRPPCDRDKTWKKGRLPISEKTLHPLYYLVVHYGLILKLCSLLKEAKRRGGQQGREWAFNQFLSWMMDRHGYLLAYELTLAKCALLPQDNASRLAAQNILHLGGSEPPDEMANKAWAAAWDMFYVRYPDPGRLAPPQYKRIALASADTDTPAAMSRAHLVEQISDISVYIAESELELPPNEYTTDLGYGISILSRSEPRDSACDPYRALDDLERSLGVQRRTITAFRECPGPAGSSFLESLERLDRRK